MKEETTNYLSCSGVRGVSWDGGVYRMYVFKRSLPALPEILQTFPSDASVFGIFPCTMQRILCITRRISIGYREKGKELLSYVPYYANHPLVQEAVRELEQLESQQKKLKKAGKGTLESTEDGRCVIERYQRKSAGSKSKDPQSCLPAS